MNIRNKHTYADYFAIEPEYLHGYMELLLYDITISLYWSIWFSLTHNLHLERFHHRRSCWQRLYRHFGKYNWLLDRISVPVGYMSYILQLTSRTKTWMNRWFRPTKSRSASGISYCLDCRIAWYSCYPWVRNHGFQLKRGSDTEKINQPNETHTWRTNEGCPPYGGRCFATQTDLCA